MGTNSRVGDRSPQRGPYKHHPVAFKREVVEASLKPGASVARLAREHGINANQLFLWRKQHREGMLGETSASLLPVTIKHAAVAERSRVEPTTGSVRLESGRIRLHIEGRPDAQTLRLILAELRRP